jgi:hypothetical protein
LRRVADETAQSPRSHTTTTGVANFPLLMQLGDHEHDCSLALTWQKET